MAENSVDSYINAQPEEIMDQDSHYRQWMKDNYGWSDAMIGHYGDFNYKIAKFFGDQARNRYDAGKYYDTYVANVTNRNEALATQSARDWDKYMDDTKVQRALDDYEKAGLNPYLLVNTGSNFVGSAPTSAKASYGGLKSSDKSASKGRNAALLILALARLAAALL